MKKKLYFKKNFFLSEFFAKQMRLHNNRVEKIEKLPNQQNVSNIKFKA